MAACFQVFVPKLNAQSTAIAAKRLVDGNRSGWVLLRNASRALSTARTRLSFDSLSHRYGSRDGLLAAAWREAIRTFQVGFLASLCSGNTNAGEGAALETLNFGAFTRIGHEFSWPAGSRSS